jgi:hypothetical protein
MTDTDMNTAVLLDATVRIAAGWLCPCGRRDVSPLYLERLEDGSLRWLCGGKDSCHREIFLYEPV